MIVEVTWEDAYFRERILTPDEAKESGAYLSRTVGWLVKRDKDYIRVAMQQINDGTVRDLMVIPACMVRKVRRLR